MRSRLIKPGVIHVIPFIVRFIIIIQFIAIYIRSGRSCYSILQIKQQKYFNMLR